MDTVRSELIFFLSGVWILQDRSLFPKEDVAKREMYAELAERQTNFPPAEASSSKVEL